MIATHFDFICDSAKRITKMALYEGQLIEVSNKKLLKWLGEY